MAYNVYRISFKEGNQAVWITDQCPDLESALLGAIEKFGKKRIKHIEINSPEVGEIPPLPPVNFSEIEK